MPAEGSVTPLLLVTASARHLRPETRHHCKECPVAVAIQEAVAEQCGVFLNAFWQLGGVPREHRTDRMSAAVNNLCDGKEFTQAYEGLLRHYRIGGQRSKPDRPMKTGMSNNGITVLNKRPIRR